MQVSHAHTLDSFAAHRADDGPVRLGTRSMVQDTGEELADAANYVRWEIVRALEQGRTEWAEACERILGDVLRAWRTLEQAAALAVALGIPATELDCGETTERHH